MRQIPRRFFTSTLLLLLSLSFPLFAQEQTASIQGTVTDSSGGALPGATVEAINAQGSRFSAVSDSNGRYRFPSVPPGTYTVTGSLSGLDSASAKGLVVTLGSTPRVDLKLRLGTVAESISVTADAPLVDVTSSAISTEIRSEDFEKLPKGRDFTTIVTQAASANQETKAGGISIDGASGSENRYVVDGADTTHPRTGTSGKIVITDFIDTVQVKSAGYQAEFGGAIGGVINVVTKTGTNDLSGNVGAVYSERSWGGKVRPLLQTNPAGTAPEYFQPRRDETSVVEPTIALGGPILRDRLWFFAGYTPQMQSVERTTTFTNGATGTFDQDFQRDNIVGTLAGNLGSKLFFKAAGNNSSQKFENSLPGVDGRGNSSAAQYTGKDDIDEDRSFSGYADLVASPSWFFSLKGGQWYSNFYQEGYPSDPVINFRAGSPSVFPEVPASLHRPQGFNTIPTNAATSEDSFTRDNVALEGTWFPQFLGTHNIKAGVQMENLNNTVDSGFQNYYVRTYWNRPGPFLDAARQGKYGVAGVYVFKTFGKVDSENLGIFLQDSWTTLDNKLTLNVGVRSENEKIPSYADPALGLPDTAIEFGFEDKLAPRLGFAYDVAADGRWKAYGSWGRYFDITKLEMPRGSFGGDKWIWYNMKIDDPDWTKWKCTNVTTVQSVIPSCTGMTYVNSVDLRFPSLDLIEPNLQPMESEEFNVGLQHQFTNTVAFGVRYVNKKLLRTIEDVGVLVTSADGSQHEEYFTANPGFGVAARILGPGLPALPKATRDYQAIELEATKRFVERWSVHASYVYSELTGNYSGLASSDENGRTSPNVNRYFDNLFNSFDAQGKPVFGKLATDRPHQFKAQAAYSAPFGTSVGVNQYVGSGTPISTEFSYEGVPFFAYGRGDMGRTPTITQTDLLLMHDFRIFGDYAFQVGLNVLNLFDEDTVTNISSLYSTTGLNVSNADFFKGFDPLTKLPNAAVNKSPLYGQASAFQTPRAVRFNAKFTF